MKNTIYLDSDFNFLLLENEEDNGLNQTKIYINIPTSAATNQEIDISVAGGAPTTESIASETVVNFELSQEYWADNGDVEITPKNDDITGATITIHFPGIFTTSAALNYIADDEFEIIAQSEEFAEQGSGSGSGSGSGGGSSFDFIETIRNIGFRLLDEPANVNAYFDEAAGKVQIKWTDPADIATNEPAPATWAGTVVVRKEGSAPRHRWDGVEIIDSTTRDEYSATALIDNTVEINKSYYYGIFPYDTKGDYRFTKVIGVQSSETTFSWLYDSAKPYGYQFPEGLDYDLGNIRENSSTLLPIVEADCISMTAAFGVASTIVFTSRLSICSTLKLRLKRTGSIVNSAVHILGGIDKSNYAKLTPNYNNRSIYNIYSDSLPDAFQHYLHDEDLPIDTETTISISLPETSQGLYVAILAGFPIDVLKIWGE